MTTYPHESIDRPQFDTPEKVKPTLVMDDRNRDPMPVITAVEPCPVCDGEGHTMHEVPGGRWNPQAQGGMWEPDETRHECEVCDGKGTITARRCARCGHFDQDDENGLAAGIDGYTPTFCECDPEDTDAFMARLRLIEGLATEQVNFAVRAKAAGISLSTNLHGLSWNETHALAAIHGQRVVYFPNHAPPFVSTRVVVGEDTVTVFGSWSKP